MKTTNKVDLIENNYGVHLHHPFDDRTLCGESNDGGISLDELTPIKKTKKRRVTCEQCLLIIEACQDYILSLK
jgi:hypothetical protein